ncbi:MAG: permease-like cell division protein FtsX [Culicoidibacterales bacterium]
MMMKYFRMGTRHWREAFKGIWRHRMLAFSAVLSVAVALFLTSFLVLVVLNVNNVTSNLEKDIKIYATIKKDTSAEAIDNLIAQTRTLGNVAEIQYKTADQELDDLILSYGEEGKIFESYRDDNPLKATLTFTLIDPRDAEATVTALTAFSELDKIQYGQETAENILQIFDTVQRFGAFVVLAVMVVAVVLISNTIRMAIMARRTEIEIMRLVGASNFFIRWPFILEGLIIGILGSIIPVGLTIVGYTQLYGYLTNQGQLALVRLAEPSEILLGISLLTIAIGAFVGILGSLFSMTKFLKK